MKKMKFRNIETAMRASEKTIKPSVVILGDDNLYWLVSLAQGQRLVNLGYEIAE